MIPGHWKHDSAGKSIMGVRTRVNHPDENDAGEVRTYVPVRHSGSTILHKSLRQNKIMLIEMLVSYIVFLCTS